MLVFSTWKPSMWQGSWNAESLWSSKGSADLWSNRGYHPFQEDPYWMAGEYYCLPLQGHPWVRKLLRPQIAKTRSLRFLRGWLRTFYDYKWTSMTYSLASYLDAAPQMPYSLCAGLQEMCYAINKTLYMAFVDLEDIWLCTQTFYPVGSSQARHSGVQPEGRVQCESGCSPRLLP